MFANASWTKYQRPAHLLLAAAMLMTCWVGCQELPTEPVPIDLSRATPVAVEDEVATPEETLVRISVLANDSSLVDDELTLTEIVTQPKYGTASINGAFIEYEPEVDYNGPDSLRYKVSGGVLSSTARVVITVEPVNDPPVATDDTFSVNESIAIPKGQVASLDVLQNDTDFDGDILRVVGFPSAPSNGSVDIASDGFSVSFEPTSNFTGTDQFTYRISDGNGGQDLATVVVTVQPVNDAPTVVNNLFATAEDEPKSWPPPGVLLGASDPENDPLTAVLVTDVSHGSLDLMENGSFHYAPDPEYHGPDSFTFAASDGQSQSAPATATITVIDVNDAPVATPDSYSTQEDAVLNVSAPGVLANDSDADGDPLNLTLVSSTTHGFLELRTDGSFTYLSEAGFSGGDQFEYQISDGFLTARAVATISVGTVNDTPVAFPDQYDVAANLELVVPVPGVLENDIDEEGDALVSVVVGAPTGLLNLRTNGGFTYAPPAGYVGTDSFTYRASDGNSQSDVTSVTILVTALGIPPVAVDDSFAADTNQVLQIPAPGLLDNDTDEDADALTAILVDDVAVGTLELGEDGGFTYTPALDFGGVVTFTYRAYDGANVSQIATVTITIGE